MLIKRPRLMFTISMLYLVVLLSGCSESTEPTSTVTLRMEIISRSQVWVRADSSLYYYRAYPEWNVTAFLDTLRADSLAESFAKSKYNITDMLFPNGVPICLKPYNTFNLAYLKLSSPDSAIEELGFNKITYDFSGCFSFWRHYKYIRN